jgi:acyl carrier protein phosphodiesterase
MQITLHYMKQYDWLSHYEQQEGIIRSLRGMSSRVRGGEKLLVAIDKFPLLIPSIQETFEQVFSDLTIAVKDHISETNSSYLDSNHYY